MMRILCAAENFAYGPAGKLLTVARRLKERQHDLFFVGYGTAWDLASKSNLFSEVFQSNTDGADFVSTNAAILEHCDLVVSAMDRGSVLAAKKMGKRVVWIDSLFYWWDELPDEVLSADVYIKQDVLEDSRGMYRFSDRIRNLVPVGPIVEGEHEGARWHSRDVLISFGGMEAPGWYETGKNHNYPEVVSRLLIDYVDFSVYDHVRITGASVIMDELRDKFGNSGVEFLSLDHDDFIGVLRSSEVVLLPGGMESALEAFANGVPAVFLPPLNITHHLQVTAFRALNAARFSISLEDYFRMPKWESMSRREKVDSFMEIARRWQDDDLTKRDMARCLDSWVNDRNGLKRIAGDQAEFFASLRGGGVDRVVAEIEVLNPRDNAHGRARAFVPRGHM